jgi:molybdopterin molybdotransferase
MTPFIEALDTVLASVRPLGSASVELDEAAGYVLAKDVVSDVDLPPFDRAAMDGYAVRTDDLAAPGAVLRVIARVGAGESAEGLSFGPGECCRIFTGAPVPSCADAVIQQEFAEAGGGTDDVRFTAAARSGENIARRGEDVRSGARVLEAGRALRPSDMSIAAAAGAGTLEVVRRARVTVLSTGDELVAPGEAVQQGQIRDANGPALTALFRAAGFAARFAGISRDNREDVRRHICAALDGCDILAVSAGVSVGDRDFVPEALAEAGFELRIESIAIKPGKPTKFGMRGAQAVFGIPGNPVSALVVAELLVLPALRRMSGMEAAACQLKRGVLIGALRKKTGRMYFAPARIDGSVDERGRTRIDPVATHGSADAASFAEANCLVALGADIRTAEAGEEVEYYERES